MSVTSKYIWTNYKSVPVSLSMCALELKSHVSRNYNNQPNSTGYGKIAEIKACVNNICHVGGYGLRSEINQWNKYRTECWGIADCNHNATSKGQHVCGMIALLKAKRNIMRLQGYMPLYKCFRMFSTQNFSLRFVFLVIHQMSTNLYASVRSIFFQKKALMVQSRTWSVETKSLSYRSEIAIFHP